MLLFHFACIECKHKTTDKSLPVKSTDTKMHQFYIIADDSLWIPRANIGKIVYSNRSKKQSHTSENGKTEQNEQ